MLNKPYSADSADKISARNALARRRTLGRPQVRGKFLFLGEEKLWVRGVTYGTFRPDESGANYPSPDVVERDFAAITMAGLNALRLYTVPPTWLLDLAAAQGLLVMIGLPGNSTLPSSMTGLE